MQQPLASVHPNAQIGENVTISPFVTIEDNVVIGDGSWIGPNSTIMSGTRMGKNCKVFPGAVVGAAPQDLKFAGEESLAEIGDNVTIRECVTINRGTVDRMTTKVGSNTLLMAYVHVAHDCIIGENCILANNVNLAGHITVEDWAILGGMVAIQQFTRIGQHAFISGGSLLNKDVPPFVKAARFPATYAGINAVGLRRRQFTREQIYAIEDTYRLLFARGLNTSQAIEKIEEELKAGPERDAILKFVRTSQIGIIKGI